LRGITEPSGRIITVDYEADDYAYVQNRPAMRLFPISSVNADAASSVAGQVCPVGAAELPGLSLAVPCAPRAYFMLDKPLPCSSQYECNHSLEELKRRYLGGNERIFFKIRVALKVSTPPAAVPVKWQTVSGYANVTGAGLVLPSPGELTSS